MLVILLGLAKISRNKARPEEDNKSIFGKHPGMHLAQESMGRAVPNVPRAQES
jgi:hypothetical protein